jgi:hypothetical protein
MLERVFGGRRILGAHGRAEARVAPRPPGERDERDAALARSDRLGRVADMDDVGRAAAIGRVEMAERQPL